MPSAWPSAGQSGGTVQRPVRPGQLGWDTASRTKAALDKGPAWKFSGICYVIGPSGRWGAYLPAASAPEDNNGPSGHNPDHFCCHGFSV